MIAEVITTDGRLIASIEDEVNLPTTGDIFVLPDFTAFRVVQRAFVSALASNVSLRGPVDLSKPRSISMKIQLTVVQVSGGEDDAE